MGKVIACKICKEPIEISEDDGFTEMREKRKHLASHTTDDFFVEQH